VQLRFLSLPTSRGARLSLKWTARERGSPLALDGVSPPGGFVLRLPPELRASAAAGGEPVPTRANGDVRLRPEAKSVEIMLGT
jgi:hypothetical protein